jgi:WXXGXW repeat (2 copies)
MRRGERSNAAGTFRGAAGGIDAGPVNEAFAQPVNLENQTGLIAPTAPPADIEEIPPAEKPTGDQSAWVPGYWAWDSDRNGYIWVSGCWRAVPPGMSWIPGYWVKTAEGWQWAAGFWVPAGNKEIEYLPAPPALTGVEPSGPAPSPDSIWVPPCWYWHNGQYIQRHGYRIAAQANWVWVPSHYVWTPRGYVFANGHWDYALDRRGILFAPVYFPGRIYQRGRFSYALSIAVDIDNLEFDLFARPKYSHYYMRAGRGLGAHHRQGIKKRRQQ